MGFSAQKYQREHQQRPWRVHPVWRGIGCALILLIPIMSWFGAIVFLQSNTVIVLPPELTNVVTIRVTTHIHEIDNVILNINNYFKAQNLVTGQLFFTVIFAFLGFGIMALLYALMYRMAGPPRYGPFDVPPNVK